MPQLGESVTEGTIGRWLVQPGEAVRRYQPLAEVITDKVNAELPAPADGIILALEAPEGATVPVGALIATMAEAGAPGEGPAGGAGEMSIAASGQVQSGAGREVSTSAAEQEPTSVAREVSTSAAGQEPASVAREAFTTHLGPAPASPQALGMVSHGGRSEAAAERGPARYSPAVLRLAQEHGLDLSQIRGTGLGGRITRKDVEAAAQAKRTAAQQAGSGAAQEAPGTAQEALGTAQAAPSTAQALADAASPPVPGTVRADSALPLTGTYAAAQGPVHAPLPTGTYAAEQGSAQAPLPAPAAGDQVLPVDPVRRRIAEKMVRSRREAPHAWSMVPVDVTDLVKLRTQAAEEFRRREGVPLSYVAFFIKAVAESLKEHPILNSQWAGEQIILKREINISVAVATETALAVPVIKGADRLSIAGLCHAIADVAARARAGKLTLEDITGGTFTVNNTGAFGSVLSQPIINYPQAAILSFEAITKTPVVLENDAIAIRSIMNICLSIDHRILDGLAAGRFLQAVRARLESMGPGRTSLY